MERLQKVPETARMRGGLPLALGLMLALLAVAVLAGRALAQESRAGGSFDLTGVVTDQGGAPLVGAWVALSGDEWGSLTDEAGRFRIPNVDPGATALVVQQLGYEALHCEGDVRAGAPLTLRMTGLDFLTARAGVPRVGCDSDAWSDTCFLVRGRAVAPTVWVDEAPLIGGTDYRFMERAAKHGLRPFPFIL